MKIAFFFNNLSNTGTNIATRDLIFQLKKSYEVDIDVFFFDKVDNELIINEKNTQISFFSNIDFTIYNIVHSSNLRSDLYVFLCKFFRFKNKHTKYVTSVHSIIKEDLNYTYGKLISKIFSPFWILLKKNNDAIIVSSDSMSLYYQKIFKNRNLNVIEYGRSIDPLIDFVVSEIDMELILNLKSNYKIIGTVGALIKRKNYSIIIDLLNKDENYAWICLGEGEDFENLVRLINENNLETRVLFLGFKTDSRPFYKYFDLFFHPSRSEGFALVIIDAMSHKIPMLLSNLSVYKSIIKEDMAFYFDLDNDISLHSTFMKISEGGINVNNAIDKSFKIYENKFSIDQYGLKHFEIFKNLIKEKQTQK